MLPAQPNQSVLNALTCLEAVVASPVPVGVRELARQLGLNRALVNRLLMTLASNGILDRTDEGRYRSGHGLHAFAALASTGSGLQRIALPFIRSWRDDGFAVSIGVLWGASFCYMIRARPEIPLEDALVSRPGPAMASSAALALLAAKPAAERKGIALPVPDIVAGPPQTAEQHIARARRDGFARLDFTDGAVSLGTVIGAPPFAGMAVSRIRLTPDRIPAVLERLRADAAAIRDAWASRSAGIEG